MVSLRAHLARADRFIESLRNVISRVGILNPRGTLNIQHSTFNIQERGIGRSPLDVERWTLSVFHRFRGSRRAGLLAVWLCLAGGTVFGQDAPDPILAAWLEAHQKLQTWSADLVQTRHLAALAQPLVATGRVHYSQPGLFRWELGQPPETIAVRSPHELLLIYPGLKRAERYPLGPAQPGPLRDALTLMEAGFPKNEATLREGYAVSTQPAADGLCRIQLEPKTATAKRLVTRVSLTFQTNVFNLTASEIEFADGSRLQNQFSRRLSNQPLPPDLFSTNLPPDYRLVEPFKP
ncbi:MAG: outer membrane lipoprotein carrier protein LolA [Verrucomicrobia bacterium]|jgi:outer membrane lipoprotein-sorting protein|nr:outer membrane lipoprotein carrier protein LolA [Verrucomicrobiota bacterium]